LAVTLLALIAQILYLVRVELHACDRLVEIHASKLFFFCLPITFLTIPVFAILAAVLILILIFRRFW
jgi:hypothetical protein